MPKKRHISNLRYLKIGGEVISTESFQRYKAQFGNERAEGYLQAIRDFKEALSDIIFPRNLDGVNKKMTRIENFHMHNYDFLKSMDDSQPVKYCNPAPFIIR